MYSDSPIPDDDIDNDVFALDSTTVSLSLKLFAWVKGKYSRGAFNIHTMLDLRVSNPTFIFITDGKYRYSNLLDENGCKYPCPQLNVLKMGKLT
jgi:hypothetical protein